MDKAIIAKKICEKYGIEWDDTQNIPHIGRKVVVPGMISAAFEQNRLGAHTYNIKTPPMVRTALAKDSYSEYSMKSTVVLVA